jgi:hypothetical protein
MSGSPRVQLFYYDAKGLIEQPKETTVRREKLGDPSFLTRLIAQFKGKTQWTRAGAVTSSFCPLCHDAVSNVTTHLLEDHEHEVRQRRSNPDDPLMKQFPGLHYRVNAGMTEKLMAEKTARSSAEYETSSEAKANRDRWLAWLVSRVVESGYALADKVPTWAQVGRTGYSTGVKALIYVKARPEELLPHVISNRVLGGLRNGDIEKLVDVSVDAADGLLTFYFNNVLVDSIARGDLGEVPSGYRPTGTLRDVGEVEQYMGTGRPIQAEVLARPWLKVKTVEDQKRSQAIWFAANKEVDRQRAEEGKEALKYISIDAARGVVSDFIAAWELFEDAQARHINVVGHPDFKKTSSGWFRFMHIHVPQVYGGADPVIPALVPGLRSSKVWADVWDADAAAGTHSQQDKEREQKRARLGYGAPAPAPVETAEEPAPDAAEVILQQLGGMGKLRAMLSARFVKSDDSLTVKWPKNIMKITLRGDDLYDVEFFDQAGTPTSKVEGVYAEDLKPLGEKTTGWRFSL